MTDTPFERCVACGGVLGPIYLVGDTGKIHRRCKPAKPVDDPLLRLRRIEKQFRDLEIELREQASGSQDGYLLGIADRIKEVLA